MNFIRLLPAILSLLLLSAHFSKIGIPILSIVFLIVPFLLLIKKQWVPQLIQIVLIIGFFEWIRALLYYVQQRLEIGEPYVRLIIIIGVVALFTGFSTLVFRNRKIRELYIFKQ